MQISNYKLRVGKDRIKNHKINVGFNYGTGTCIHTENILESFLIISHALVMGKISKQYEIGITVEATKSVELYRQ